MKGKTVREPTTCLAWTHHFKQAHLVHGYASLASRKRSNQVFMQYVMALNVSGMLKMVINFYFIHPFLFFSKICIFCALLCKLLVCMMLVARAENGKLYLVKYKNLAHVHNRWVPEAEIAVEAPELLSKFNWRMQKEKVSLHFPFFPSFCVFFFLFWVLGIFN